jgi:hypothetical protein
MAKNIRHTGWKVERCRWGLLERIFAERWRAENVRDRYTAGGILQQLFMRQEGESRWYWRPRLLINRRDSMVAATVVQWLGTNVGYGFLTECLRRAGLRIVEEADYTELLNRANGWALKAEEKYDDRYYNRPVGGECLGYETIPGAWQNHVRKVAPHSQPPEVAEMRRPYHPQRYKDERRARRAAQAQD